jgi:hypothetical protein
MLALVVPFGWKAFFEYLICIDSGLGKTIHPLLYLNVDSAVRSDNAAKVVMDDDFVGDDVQTDMHILGVRHGGVEVEIGKIDAQKLGPRGTDGGSGIDE